MTLLWVFRITNSQHLSKMRIFTNTSWCQGFEDLEVIPVVQFLKGKSLPYEGDVKEQPASYIKANFYHRLDLPIVESPIESCDAIFLPVVYNNYAQSNDVRLNLFHDICRQAYILARKFNKPLVVHASTRDITNPSRQISIPVPEYYYLSTNIRNSIAPRNHIAQPYFIPNYFDVYPDLQFKILDKPCLPSVGFCGVAAPLSQKQLNTKMLLDWLRLYLVELNRLGIDTDTLTTLAGTNMKHAYRAKLLKNFQRNQNIKCDVILREQGGLVNRKYWDDPLDSAFHRQYFTVMSNNAYIPCCRGTENYSIRFYETFSLGRIPVLVDSDLRLPFSNQIDYDRHCCLIPKRSIHKASEILCRFHSRLSSRDFKNIQVSNRGIWEDYLSIQGFYNHLPELLTL